MIILQKNPVKTVCKWISNYRIMLLMFFLGAIFIAAPLWFVIRGGGDDTNFVTTAHQYNLMEFVVMRYLTWSSRIFSEMMIWIFAHLDLIYWKIVDLLLYLLQSFMLYQYYLLFARKYDQPCEKSDPVALIACLVIPFSMDFLALKDAVFWVTGAMNYLWPAALGLAGFYLPLRYTLTGSTGFQSKLGSIAAQIGSYLLLLCGLVSSEQMGAIFVAFYLLFNLYYVLQNKRVSVYLLWQVVFAIIIYLLIIKAPGVAERTVAETQNYIPDFQTVALSLKLNYSARWFFDAIINQMGMLLPTVWVLLCVYIFKTEKKFGLIDIFSLLCIFLGFVAFLLKDSTTAFLFDFQASWGIPAFGVTSYLPMLFWMIVLLSTIVELIRIGCSFYEKMAYLFVSLGIACSIAVIVFSPTMYASGDRTKYIPSILSIVLIFMLYAKLKNLDWKNSDRASLALLALPICYGFVQYFDLLSRFSHQFTLH